MSNTTPLRRVRPGAPLLVPLLLAACAAPDTDRLFVSVNAEIELGEDEAADHFRGLIDAAEDTLHVALPGGENVDLADTIVDAWDRGVEVEVITDFDLATSPAITRLIENDVPVALRDAGLVYFDFGQNVDLGFPSDMTVMSDAWVVQDRKRLLLADRIGTGDDGARVVFEILGEDVIEDVLWEHRQIYGGTDATAVDAYSAPNKSILEGRWRYGTTSDEDLEVWFGPQERLLKRVIDAIYSARASVWVLTDDFSSQGMADALQDKARWGFDVQVVVGPHFGESNSLLSRFLTDADQVPTRQILDVQDVPTVVLIDYEDDAEGYRPRTRAMVLTHDLFSASRLYRGDPVLTDQLIDGTMVVLTDVTNEPSDEMLELHALFQDHYDRSEAL